MCPCPLRSPPRPSLEWLRKTAKERLTGLRAAEPAAKLSDAQRAVARHYGFASWRALKAHVERATAPPEPASAEAIVAAFLQRVGTGRIDDVRAMLKAAPALVNAIGPHPFWGGRPQPLHVAIEGKRRDVVDLLLAHGADVNGTNDSYGHWSPLMLAINRKAPDLRDELLRRGARVGLVEALILADDHRVDEWLHREGLPDIVPNDGSILAFARTPFAIDRLIAIGAPVDLKDQWGTPPIAAMSRMGPEGHPLVDRLIAHGVHAAPREYARLGDTETLARLVESDPAVARLAAVMMAAVEFRHHRLVRWLLERGADVNARTDVLSRHTALHAAAWNGDVPMVELLVRAGPIWRHATPKEIRQPRRPSQGRADLSGLRRVGDAEVHRTSPAELADLPVNFWDEAEVGAPTAKRAISLRLDEDVLDWFRRSGPHDQTRMNAVLWQ